TERIRLKRKPQQAIALLEPHDLIVGREGRPGKLREDHALGFLVRRAGISTPRNRYLQISHLHEIRLSRIDSQRLVDALIDHIHLTSRKVREDRLDIRPVDLVQPGLVLPQGKETRGSIREQICHKRLLVDLREQTVGPTRAGKGRIVPYAFTYVVDYRMV